MLRLFILLCPLFSLAQTSLNMELLDNWHDNNLMVNSSEDRYNDCWGFVQNGQEYAVIGSTEGVHFFRITDENTFEFIDEVDGTYQATTVIHRDIKVHNGYAYTVCDEGGSLQIINLAYLPDSVHVVYDSTDPVDPFNKVHNLFIDSENELMYACGVTEWQMSSPVPKGMTVYSLANPELPSLIWSAPGTFPYVHDAYVRNNIAYLNCGDDGLRVYDFSNPSNPFFLQNLNIYQQQGYNHQGWMTPDGSKFIFGDETNGVKLKKCTVNPDHTLTIDTYFGTSDDDGSIPHNIMLSDDYAYVAYYNEGLRIYDIRSNVPKEIAFYDTYPDESEFKMEGAWGIYSDLPTGRLLVSDRKYGLFLLDFEEKVFDASADNDLALFPNPASTSEVVTIRLDIDDISEFSIAISDLKGRQVREYAVSDQTYFQFVPDLSAGMYQVTVKYFNYLGEQEQIKRKLIVK